MAQHGSNDNAANSTLWAVGGLNVAANSENRDNLFNNTTVSAYITGQAVGQFGASNAEVGVAGEGKSIAHTGWQLRRAGTGSVMSFTLVRAGASYSNADSIRVTSEAGVNATANLVTNGSGNIVSISEITNPGSGFTSVNPTLVIVTSTGSGANIVATAGGRAGRVHYETLVAMSIDGDASDDTYLPNS